MGGCPNRKLYGGSWAHECTAATACHGNTTDALTCHISACEYLHACLQGGGQQGPNLRQSLPEPMDTGQAGTAGPGKGFVSPLQLDRLAMFHDIVTSPEARPITHRTHRRHCQSRRSLPCLA